ncbi:MAG: filamentous hemagglutinin N-terminal domain-containing protein [Planctomycetota bacterium]
MKTHQLLCASIRRQTRRSAAAAVLAAAGVSGAPALAAPQGGNVVAGSATINTAGKTTTINTATARTIIEFDSFNITNSQSVIINQPNSNSAILNRVTNGSPTAIQGQLSSNGQVFIVNPAGVSFSSTAVVNVGRLVAAGANMSDADFLAGIEQFTDATGSVVNNSQNFFGDTGVVLVGKNVTNNGTIVSDGGAIILVAGKDVLIQEGPGDQVLVKIEGFGTTRGRVSRLVNTGTVDAGDGQVVLGAGDLLGLSALTNGRVLADRITVDTGDVPLTLSQSSSAFEAFDDDAAITINTSLLTYFCDEAPNGRLTLNAPDGFVNLSASGPDCGPAIVNGEPFVPGSPGTPTDPGTPGGPGTAFDSTFVDAYARALPVDALAVAPGASVKVDAGQIAALERDLGIDVKSYEEQPLLEYLVTATVLNDLANTPDASGGTRVSAERLNYTDAQAALDAYGNVFYVNSLVDDLATPGSDAGGAVAGTADATATATGTAAVDNQVGPTDQTQQVRSLIQQAADRYMADAEVTEIDPGEFVEWLRDQDPEALEALAGLDELVNEAMPNLGLGNAELNNFKRWTYGKIAPQGVSLRTLDELVAAAGRG